MKTAFEILSQTSPKIVFRSYREAAARIAVLETELGLPPGKPIYGVRQGNERIRELETLLAARAKAAPVIAATPAPAAVAPDAAMVARCFGKVVSELKAEAPAVTGRARFNAAIARDAAALSKVKNPHLSGRQRFAADLRIVGTPENLPAAPVAAGLSGLEKFKAAIKKDFSKK
jgi:hypothetical protein